MNYRWVAANSYEHEALGHHEHRLARDTDLLVVGMEHTYNRDAVRHIGVLELVKLVICKCGVEHQCSARMSNQERAVKAANARVKRGTVAATDEAHNLAISDSGVSGGSSRRVLGTSQSRGEDEQSPNQRLSNSPESTPSSHSGDGSQGTPAQPRRSAHKRGQSCTDDTTPVSFGAAPLREPSARPDDADSNVALTRDDLEDSYTASKDDNRNTGSSPVPATHLPDSSNGKTSAFGVENRGSSPRSGASETETAQERAQRKFIESQENRK